MHATNPGHSRPVVFPWGTSPTENEMHTSIDRPRSSWSVVFPRGQAPRRTRPIPPAGLMRRPPAVDHQHAADHVARRVAGQKDGRALNLFHASPAFQGRGPDHELLAFLGLGNGNV